MRIGPGGGGSLSDGLDGCVLLPHYSSVQWHRNKERKERKGKFNETSVIFFALKGVPQYSVMCNVIRALKTATAKMSILV